MAKRETMTAWRKIRLCAVQTRRGMWYNVCGTNGKEADRVTLEEARVYFGNDRYAAGLSGAEILDVGERYAKCAMPLDTRHRNAIGLVMGGVPFVLADFAFAVATASGYEGVTVTVNSTISYLRPCTGSRLTAEAVCMKDGVRNCFYRITITDESGKETAVVMTTGAHLAAAPKNE